MDSFSNRLKVALEIRCMKPADLAAKSGVSRSDISNYLKGRYKAKQDKLYPIAKALDVLPEWLMGCDVPMTASPSIVEPRHVTASLSPDELRLLTAYRNADDRAREDALATLESHPREEKKENRA